MVLSAVLLLLTPLATARNVDTGEIVPLVDDRGLVRLAYANDYFSGTDRYYTQGVAIDVFHPILKKSPLMRVLPFLPDSTRFYGIALRDSTFTASHTDFDGPLIGDRPYSAYAFIGHVLVSRDQARGLTLVAEFDAGMIGQGVGGQTQKWAHRVLNDTDPHGWNNQIRNDVVLDYYARLEKVVQSCSWEDLSFGADATAGTLYDNAGAEGTLRVGRFAPGAKKRAYVFGRAMEKAVGYDATLQGGATNRHSTYTLNASQVDRFVARADLGIAVDLGRLALTAVWSDLGPEFRNGLTQRWVEVSILARF
jgi:lipid A 3-O-deacylase